MRLLVLAALLAGCGIDQGGLEPFEAAQARDAAWAWYGRTDAPPALELATELACGGWGFVARGDCLVGAYFPDRDLVVLAGTADLHTVAHEVWHAVLWRRGTPDHDHQGPGWEPGGAVDQAAAMLEARR